MFYFKLAIKSIFERHQQYKSLFLVSAVGICLMLSAIMITDGMIDSMNEKARQYYGGDLQFVGGPAYSNIESDADYAISILKECIDDDEVVVSKRYNHDASSESYYFEGTSVRQRVILGVDFENEKKLFDKFTFVEGSYKYEGAENTVLISEPIAAKLGCHIGDSITLYITTDDGFKNTLDLIVSGIFQDTSVFGMYTSYVNYNSLMKGLNMSQNEVNRIGIYYDDGMPSLIEQQKLQTKLENHFQMFPLGLEKDYFYDEYDDDGRWALISLDSNVSELKLLVQALKLIVATIVILLVIIISVGISSTYRVIVIKRNVESGTLRALGMKPSGIMRMFVTEGFVLLLSGSIVGFICALLIVNIAKIFNLSFITGFDLFLTGGCLAPSCNLVKIVLFVSVIIVTTLLSVLFTLRKLVHVSPVGAITSTN